MLSLGEARRVRSAQLDAVLTSFLEEAARFLQTDVEGGCEVPFEVERRGSSSARTPLYCYRPLTREFIAERWRALRGLPSYGPAATALDRFEGLGRYIGARAQNDGPAAERGAARGEVGLWTLLGDVFGDQTDFALRDERLEAALAGLERAGDRDLRQSAVVATLHGVAIASPEVQLTGSLAITRPDEGADMPEEALPVGPTDPVDHLLVVLTGEHDDVEAAAAHARAALADLLCALRLFGDGRVCLGRLAWVRLQGGRWRATALGDGGRPHGTLLVAEDQEDELRAFCNLVVRRMPRDSELGWALARFQMGCARADDLEALSDYLVALRALLEPDGSPRGALAGRLAALCAVEAERAELARAVGRALELERAVIAGRARRDHATAGLVRMLADHLRALLRDVICGHLDADLAALADSILEATSQPAVPIAQAREEPPVDADEPAWEAAPPPRILADSAPRPRRRWSSPAIAQRAGTPRRPAEQRDPVRARRLDDTSLPAADAALFDEGSDDDDLRLAGTLG